MSLCTNPSADGYGRPNCNHSNVFKTANGGWAEYNALELNLTTQNYHGLTSTVSYTFSKDLNNATDAFRSTGAGGSTIAFPQNPLDPSAGERGLGGNDFPNTLGIGFTYDLPKFVKGNGLLGRIANGFQLSGIYRYRSGQVYTPYQPVVLDTNTGDTSFCDGAFNADVIGVDTCRLVLSNKKAPINTVAYLNPYVNGSTPALARHGHAAICRLWQRRLRCERELPPGHARGSRVDALDHQQPGLCNGGEQSLSRLESRSLLRGQPFSDLDATICQNISHH